MSQVEWEETHTHTHMRVHAHAHAHAHTHTSQFVSCWPLTADDWFWSQASAHEICDQWSGTGTSFFSKYFSFPLSLSFNQSIPSFLHLSLIAEILTTGSVVNSLPHSLQCCWTKKMVLWIFRRQFTDILVGSGNHI